VISGKEMTAHNEILAASEQSGSNSIRNSSQENRKIDLDRGISESGAQDKIRQTRIRAALGSGIRQHWREILGTPQ